MISFSCSSGDVSLRAAFFVSGSRWGGCAATAAAVAAAQCTADGAALWRRRGVGGVAGLRSGSMPDFNK